MASNRRNRRKPTFRNGLGYQARDIWSGGKQTPNPEQQLSGFYIGQVMDDQDPQRRGRVWVYIPEISPNRFDEDSLPTYGGTAPDLVDESGEYNQQARNGWMLISPLTPFAGSDGFRNASGPDGRNSVQGDINSYGMWHQPRIGDYVGIMFDRGDSSSGYWIGMAQSPAVGGMVPGVPGTPASDISDRNNNEYVDQVQGNAGLPTMDRAPVGDDPTDTDPIVASDLTRNIVRAGISADPIRGAGSSGSGRESPSYVTGMKSAGWSYDGEQHNMNTDGETTFSDDAERYYHHNSVGHQIVMDDHPDHQSIRMRTSNGAQILMNDSCDDPFVYIQTATGGAWIEISDSGNISIFAESGIHIHSEGDFNLTVDGDMKVGVKGSIDMRAGGDYSLGVDGLSQQLFSGDMITEVKGEYDSTIGSYARLIYNGDIDTRIGGSNKTLTNGSAEFQYEASLRTQTHGDHTLSVDGEYIIVTGDTMSLNVAGNIVGFSSGEISLISGKGVQIRGVGVISIVGEDALQLKSGDAMGFDSGAAISILGGGNVSIDGSSNIHLNSGISQPISVDDSEIVYGTIDRAPSPVDMAAAPILPLPNRTPMGPTDAQITTNGSPEMEDSVATVVPQHQPWSGRCGAGSTSGTNASIGTSPVTGGYVPPSGNTSCQQADNVGNFRTGSGFLDALIPDFLLGGFDMANGFMAVFGGGADYTGTTQGEAPVYQSLITGGVGETYLPDSLDASTQIINYIKRQATFIRTPRLNADHTAYVVGYGSTLTVGNTVGGEVITTEDMREIRSFGSDAEKAFAITRDEAEERLLAEIAEIEDWVATNFNETEFTQQQFDGMISFIHNVGLTKLQSTPEGQQYIAAIQNRDMGLAQSTMYDHVYVGGVVDCSLVDRRRYEVGRFGQPPSRGGITAGNRNYTPSGNTVNIANFNMSEDVRNAIARAQENLSPGIPDGYLFALASIESGFNTFAQNAQSSAGGLFQFIEGTGLQYGIDACRARGSVSPAESGCPVYDPEVSSQAGAMFTNDNYRGLENAGVTGINGADLYAAHFFGMGRAPEFLLAVRNSPNTIAATQQRFRQAASVNKGVFYFRNNTPKTFAEVYQYFIDKVENPRQYFTGQFNAGIPEASGTDTSGLITWVPGVRQPYFDAPAQYQSNQNEIRSIAELSASQAGITRLGFNSAYRDPELNARVGGAQNSQHLYGRALDIHIGGMDNAQRRAFVDRLGANGVTGIGVGTNTLHVDTRTTGKATWEYNGGNSWCRDILRAHGWRV